METSDSKQINLSGSNLSMQDIYAIVSNPDVLVRITDEAFSAVQKSREFLEQEADNRIIYGANTGFGPMASRIINHEQGLHLQENLIRSHAVGIGDPIDEKYVL
ncbi:aromatic amino acid lyase, partial [Patescibacteria group bacterium]|nr:aromatic amino acid lyase [Patescibacteria group bacterium]